MRIAEGRTKTPRRVKKSKGMAIRIAGRVRIPEWVRDQATFRKWARSPACPEKARVAFYKGTLWVDPDIEQFYIHNQIKAEITAIILPLVKSGRNGRYGADGMLISNSEVGLSTVPDGFFFTFDSYRAGRIRDVAGTKNGCTEFEGSPDMILEVVSRSSETKDLVDLRELYWCAGIPEYWVADARTEEVSFEILKNRQAGYVATRRLPGGWLHSEVFQKSFRLVRGEDEIKKPTFTLEVK